MAASPKSSRTVSTQAACGHGDAALARAFEFLGKRWTGLVLGALRGGPLGFREVSRAVGGISDSVLSDRLSDLTRAGLVTRTVDEGPPLAVSYAVTDRGEALFPALAQIALWAQEHLPEDTSPATAIEPAAARSGSRSR
jgi:DNA-binding HxlR family transcriptional regulator